MHDLNTLQRLNSEASDQARAKLLKAATIIQARTGITHLAAQQAANALREEGMI